MGNNERSLIRTAELYYEEGLSQNAIAELLGTSRASISRMLDEARECGIVEIIVHTPVSKNSKLSVRLREKFGLRDAVVVAGGSLPERAKQKLQIRMDGALMNITNVLNSCMY